VLPCCLPDNSSSSELPTCCPKTAAQYISQLQLTLWA